MILCFYERFCTLFVFFTYCTEVLIFIDFDINANKLNKLAWPILPNLWGKMGHGWGKLDIDQL